MMPHEFHFTRRVEFSETDMAGIMHFSNFFRFMEAAETAFMRSLGLSVLLQKSGLNFCLPRVHAECDYAAPLQFEDEVLVRLLVERKGTRSLTYQFRFYRLNHSPEVARGRITLVCAECLPDGGLKGVPFPKELAEKLQEAPPEVLAERFSASLPKPPTPSSPHSDHSPHARTAHS
jgi:YbgC/YbaW family acyl-CoA thioester hydrolase